MNFFNKYFFQGTLVAMIIFFLLMLFLNKRIFFQKNRKIISYSIGGFQLANTILSIISNSYLGYGNTSGIRITEFCPLLAYSSSIIFFINKDNIYKMIMPGLFIASTLTMVTVFPGTIFNSSRTAFGSIAKFTADFSHVGMFFSAFFIGSLDLKYNKRDLKLLMVPPVFLTVGTFFFAAIPFFVTGDEKGGLYTSALLSPSTRHSSYGFFDDIAPYPVTTIIFYILAVSTCYFIAFGNNKKITINNWVNSKRIYIFGNLKKFLKLKKDK